MLGVAWFPPNLCAQHGSLDVALALGDDSAAAAQRQFGGKLGGEEEAVAGGW